MECSCEKCVQACKRRPGFLAPDQVQLVAEHLKMSVQDVFNQYLWADFWKASDDKDDVWLLAPATQGTPTGAEAPLDPQGQCVFYEEGKGCRIHAVKPSECAHYDHSVSPDAAMEFRKSIVEAWKLRQADVEQLLGHKPVLPEPDLMSALSMMFGAFGFK